MAEDINTKEKENKYYRRKWMKKIKKSMLLLIVFVTVIISSTSCKKKVYIDVDKCAEVALEYMKTKYNEDFEVAYKYEVRRVFGSAGYVEVDVRIKGKEKEYCVIVYPDKKKKMIRLMFHIK